MISDVGSVRVGHLETLSQYAPTLSQGSPSQSQGAPKVSQGAPTFSRHILLLQHLAIAYCKLYILATGICNNQNLIFVISTLSSGT